MSGCVNHVENGECDPRCPQKGSCHDFSGWRLPDGRRVILHARTEVPRLADGGFGDPNVDYAIAVTGNETFGKYIETIPIETLRRSGV